MSRHAATLAAVLLAGACRREVPRLVRSVAGAGDGVLIATGRSLLRVERGGATTVLGVAEDNVEHLVVHERHVFWLAPDRGPGFAIRATPLDGRPTIEVESAPVSDPRSRERTRHRIGRTKLTLC